MYSFMCILVYVQVHACLHTHTHTHICSYVWKLWASSSGKWSMIFETGSLIGLKLTKHSRLVYEQVPRTTLPISDSLALGSQVCTPTPSFPHVCWALNTGAGTYKTRFHQLSPSPDQVP